MNVTDFDFKNIFIFFNNANYLIKVLNLFENPFNNLRFQLGWYLPEIILKKK